MTKLLQPPIQTTSLTDKDGKPTSHHYRWMDGVVQSVTEIDKNLTTANTSLTSLTGSVSTLQTSVSTLTTQKLTQSTAQTTLTGNTRLFTGIPSWVKRISVFFSNITTNNAAVTPFNLIVRLGDATNDLITSNYVSGTAAVSNANAGYYATTTTGFHVISASPGGTAISGSCVLSNMTGNIWIAQTIMAATNSNFGSFQSGSVTLSTMLERVGIILSAGSFTGGTINIFYE